MKKTNWGSWSHKKNQRTKGGFKWPSFFFKNHPDWHLSFIGKVDEQQYAQEIKELARSKGVAQQLSFLAQTEQINTFYQHCALVVVPSFSEGFL